MPKKIRKMSVRCCSQVFSHTVAACMKMLANISEKAQSSSTSIGVDIDPKAADTAELLYFFDKLFDSVNGSSLRAPHKKTLRCAVTAKSPHVQFWNSAVPILRSTYFTKPGSDTKSYPPSLKNWVVSVEGLRYIWSNLEKKGFKFLSPRNSNQDPVENFFGCIRSHGHRNINPTCASFIQSFKSLLINNFVSRHSVGFNCENDQSRSP